MKKVLSETGYLWKLFGFAGLDEEEFKKRTTAVQLAFFTAVAGLVYCMVYISLGFASVVYVIFAYILVSQLNILYLRVTHNYAGFGMVQLALIFLFPLAAQLTIGGFIEASSVLLAVFLAPAGALLYARQDIARVCFYLFVAVVIGATAWEFMYGNPIPRLPRSVILFFFGSNTVMICGIVYFLLESFLKKQEDLRAELRQSLHTLKTTQNQLIQAEKMASLGQLTAGIAHEIQNPLNFVNNFSELNMELTEELGEELTKEEPDGNVVRELVQDLIQNQKKINHHGQRASGIIKGMLEHSRTGNGRHEPTDINHLCEEFLHLAYHGQRAKDNTFTVKLVTDFSPGMPLLKVIPQDLGRVLLNLLNNAFYAVGKRSKGSNMPYEPTVWLSTRKKDEGIELVVRDNGTGIPEDVITNIFQPFFTTKPTGEGTGLGLSLSYDIITGSHGGTLNVTSKPGEGTEFTILIPET